MEPLLRLKRMRERLRMLELHTRRRELALAEDALRHAVLAKQGAETRRRMAEAVIDQGLRSRPYLPRELDEVLMTLNTVDMEWRSHAGRVSGTQARRGAASDACEASRAAYRSSVRNAKKFNLLAVAVARQQQAREEAREEARTEVALEPSHRSPDEAPARPMADLA